MSSFAAGELAKRISDAAPKVILAASCGLEGSKVIPYKPALDEAIRISNCKTLEKVIMFQRSQCTATMEAGRDVDWKEYVGKNGALTEPVQMDATDPLYILYTSGTTGSPKGVVRDTASIVPMQMSMSLIYNHQPGKNNVYWSASDLGWAVGHR